MPGTEVAVEDNEVLVTTYLQKRHIHAKTQRKPSEKDERMRHVNEGLKEFGRKVAHAPPCSPSHSLYFLHVSACSLCLPALADRHSGVLQVTRNRVMANRHKSSFAGNRGGLLLFLGLLIVG